MDSRRPYYAITVLAAMLLLPGGCVFDTGGLQVYNSDQSAEAPPGVDAVVDGPAASEGIVADGPGKEGAVDSGLPESPVPDRPVPDRPVPDASPCGAITCPLGCNAALGRCNRILPSNVEHPKGYHDQISSGIVGTTNTIKIHTDTGRIEDGSTDLRPSGKDGSVDKGIFWKTVDQGSGYPKLAIFGVKSLVVPSGVTLQVLGPLSLALYVTTGSVQIDGKLVAPHGGMTPGAGGYKGGGQDGKDGDSCQGGEGQGGVDGSNSRESGGGGGGFKAKGGAGGDATGTGGKKGGAGGTAVGLADLIPLRGGCGGGGGGGSSSGRGGGGGGAIQIAANGPIVVTGMINMYGAGGAGDGTQGGGGGGAGGGILLEGSKVSVTGTGIVAANGGGGGCGGQSNNGTAGTASVNVAPGGLSTSSANGAGGAGGARASEAGDPGKPATYNGGGGGGAVGRIRINALSVSVGSTNASPAPFTSTAVTTW